MIRLAISVLSVGVILTIASLAFKMTEAGYFKKSGGGWSDLVLRIGICLIFLSSLVLAVILPFTL